MGRFDNRTVIVTGGSRGMGASHARGFVAEGANVVIADVLEQEGRTLADELGDHAIFSRLDVTSHRNWAATVAADRVIAELVGERSPLLLKQIGDHDVRSEAH